MRAASGTSGVKVIVRVTGSYAWAPGTGVPAGSRSSNWMESASTASENLAVTTASTLTDCSPLAGARSITTGARWSSMWNTASTQ